MDSSVQLMIFFSDKLRYPSFNPVILFSSLGLLMNIKIDRIEGTLKMTNAGYYETLKWN